MDLVIDRVKSEQFPRQIDLILNILFGEHREEIQGGSVTFGLRRGELRVQIIDGQIPLANIRLKNYFPIVVEKEIQEERAKGKQNRIQLGLKNSGLASSDQSIKKLTEKVKYEEHQIKIKGTEKNPIWIFEVKTDKEILEGLLQDENLATINLKADSCSLVATFHITKPEDICIIDAQWLWVKEISDKKKKVIAAGIVRRFLEKKINLNSYLSRVELVHE
ncbi:MAG: hypothetical protein AAFQ14_02795 [Cyanobacteria bacterium J06621_12]